MAVPDCPKIFHIVHVDRLASIVDDGFLRCDEMIAQSPKAGTTIGMGQIKRRRLETRLPSHPGLSVGQCVPFYFCPRSVMLYVIHRGNADGLDYIGGQGPIVHLVADLKASVKWASCNSCRWAFTTSNAGSKYFADHSDLALLNEINWEAVRSTIWSGNGVAPSIKEGKQAEFLVEGRFPWNLVERIGVYSRETYNQAADVLNSRSLHPPIHIMPEWYY